LFKVRSLGTSYLGLNSILSGSNFGVLDKPITFYLDAEGIDVPLTVNFFLSRNASKGTAYCQVGEIVNNTMDVYFYNAGVSGGSGLRHPITLVTVAGISLSLMFQVDSLAGAQFYKLSYEFFRSTAINWEAQ
jgi:hypothetical protein